MPTFNGSLRLATDPQSRVRADIEIDAERIVVNAAGDTLADWALADVDIEPAPGGFRIKADGEDLILTTGDNTAFADIVGVPTPPNGNSSVESEPASSPGAESTRFGPLRSRSAAGWVDDETLRAPLAYVIAASSILVIVGAALNWGDIRLLGEDGIAWARIFVALAGVGAAVGAYLGWREQRRMIGAGIATGAGVLGIIVMYFYARAAGIGIGYFIAMIAIVPLTGAAGLGLTKWGAPDHIRD